MAVSGERARSEHLNTLSDAAKDARGFALGAGYEFMGRPDGYEMLNRAYHIKWTSTPKAMDLGLLYRALQQTQVSMVAGSMTDATLAVIDAKVLEDDAHAFPPYQGCVVARTEALAEHPGLREALAVLAGKISSDAMRRMNYEVDGNHRQTAEVAREFLKQSGL